MVEGWIEPYLLPKRELVGLIWSGFTSWPGLSSRKSRYASLAKPASALLAPQHSKRGMGPSSMQMSCIPVEMFSKTNAFLRLMYVHNYIHVHIQIDIVYESRHK